MLNQKEKFQSLPINGAILTKSRKEPIYIYKYKQTSYRALILSQIVTEDFISVIHRHIQPYSNECACNLTSQSMSLNTWIGIKYRLGGFRVRKVAVVDTL